MSPSSPKALLNHASNAWFLGIQQAVEMVIPLGRLLRIGGEKAQARELIDGGILEQTKLRICDALPRHDLHIYLNALSGMGHLLIRLYFFLFFCFFAGNSPCLRITRNRLSGRRV